MKMIQSINFSHISRRVWRYQKGKSKKDKQHNGQQKKDKRTNNDLQSIAQKTKDRKAQTPLKLGVNSGAPER